MKKWINLILALFVLAPFFLGCARMVTPPEQIKCPKCGAVFTVDEKVKGQETR
jgi:hypothetical protein